MKKIISYILLLIILHNASALIITQVYPNPILNENGGEAVEIYNNDVSPYITQNLHLKTQSSSIDASIPEGTIIYPNQYFLITDLNWSQRKDNLSWKNSSYEESITLGNVQDLVELIDNNLTLDNLSWQGALAPQEGEVLTRKRNNSQFIDTDSNSDFQIKLANFEDKVSQNGINFQVIVKGSSNEIMLIAIGKDTSDDAGIQIMPIPSIGSFVDLSVKINSSTLINVSASFNNITAKINKVSQNANEQDFSGTLKIPISESPGQKTITVQIGSQSFDFQIELLPIIGIFIDTDELNIEIDKGTLKEIIGDNSLLTTQNPTIQNTGNIPINLLISQSGAEEVKIDYTFDIENFESQNSGTLTKTDRLVTLGIESMQTKPISFSIYSDIAGIHNGRINIKAT